MQSKKARSSKSSGNTKSTPGNPVLNPNHYKFPIKSYVSGQSMDIETVDIVNALFPQDAHLATAFIYLARAGRKQSNSYVQDVAKAKRWLEFALGHHGAPIE